MVINARGSVPHGWLRRKPLLSSYALYAEKRSLRWVSWLLLWFGFSDLNEVNDYCCYYDYCNHSGYNDVWIDNCLRCLLYCQSLHLAYITRPRSFQLFLASKGRYSCCIGWFLLSREYPMFHHLAYIQSLR